MSPITLMKRILLQALSYYDLTFNFGNGFYVNYLGAIVSLTVISIGVYHVVRLFGDDNGKD